MKNLELDKLVNELDELKTYLLIYDNKQCTVAAAKEIRCGLEAIARAIDDLTFQLKAWS